MSSSISDSGKVSNPQSRSSLTWVIVLVAAGLLAVAAVLWIVRPENGTQTTVQSTEAGEADSVAPLSIMPCSSECMAEFYAAQYSGLNPEGSVVTLGSDSAAVIAPSSTAPCDTGCLDDFYAAQYGGVGSVESAKTDESDSAAVVPPSSVAPCKTGCLDDFYAAQYGGVNLTELSGSEKAAAIDDAYTTYTDRYWELASEWEFANRR